MVFLGYFYGILPHIQIYNSTIRNVYGLIVNLKVP